MKIFLGWVLVALVLWGCEGKAEGKPTSGKIGLVVSTLDNPFFVSLRDGALETADRLGYNLVALDSQNDSMKELTNIEDLITAGVSVLLINPVDSDSVGNGIRLANQAKLPVITLDRGANSGTVVSHIASDNVAGGVLAANFLVEKLPANSPIVQLEGIPGTSAARERGEGFLKGIEGKLNLVASQTADFDRTKGLNVMENILQAHPNISAVFAQNDEMALGALRALTVSGKPGILVVGFDATDDALTAVKNGTMAATVAQQPHIMGRQGVETAGLLIQGNKVEAHIPVALQLITQP